MRIASAGLQNEASGGVRVPEDSEAGRGILEVSLSRDGEAATIALAGELDLATVDMVRDKLAEVEDDGTSRVVIDLRKLTFIDSTGIWLLLSAAKEDEEGRLSFIPSESVAVQRVFAVTGVADLFGGNDGSSAAALSET
jgi:anti-sigma B factor antagonist